MMRSMALILALAVAGCSGIGETALKTAAGAALGVDSGPSLSADLQAGKTNSKTVGTSETVDIAPVARPENVGGDFTQTTQADEKSGGVDRIEKVDGGVTINNSPPWLIMALLLAAFGALALVGLIGWLSPQPRWLRRA